MENGGINLVDNVKPMLSEKQLVEKLKTRDSGAVYQVYEIYYPVIRKMIVANTGSPEDAKDIFQESVLILIKNIQKETFDLNASLKTYIYSISKNLWLKKLRNDKRAMIVSEDLTKYGEVEQEESAESDEIKTSKYVHWLISQVPVHCQRIVRYIYFFNYSVKTVAGKMGYNSTHTASNMKYKCLKEMKKVTGASVV